ncbi:MAG: hypothetical protein ABJB74_23265 [Gemmatimonas sp.]
MASNKIKKFNRYFVCGIDGTVDHFAQIGKNLEANQRDYDEKFAKSFVRQICNNVGSSRYFRGPAATGSGLGWAMDNALLAIAERYGQDAAEYVRTKNDWYDPDRRGYILCGYSRGAAGIIEVATRLQQSLTLKNLKIKIYAMILFDCVNETATSVQGAINHGAVPGYSNPRSIISGSSMIPSNIENCVHFIRGDDTNSRADTMAKYTGGAVDHGKTAYTAMYFKATHGGLGGLPYFKGTGEGNNINILEPGSATATNVTMAEDIWASRQVAKFATAFCARLGVPCAVGVL